MSGFPSKVKHLAWDRSAALLASSGGDFVTVWDVTGKGPAGRTPLQLTGHSGKISYLAYQKRGELLASGCEAGAIIIWNPAQCQWPLRKPMPTDRHVRATRFSSAINQVGWSPDESILAVGCQDGTVALQPSQ